MGTQTIEAVDSLGNKTTATVTVNGGHAWGEYVSNNDATATADGTMTAVCRYCSATNTVTDVGSATGGGNGADQDTPTQADKPTEDKEPVVDGEQTAPGTGEHSRVWIWLLLAGVSAIVLVLSLHGARIRPEKK